jgi:CRISPR system Cascade subunit CasA
MEGYSGRSNYGIVRMNGGYGSRPAFHLAADDRWATKFGRDVEVWLEQRQALVETFGYREAGGVGLVWLEPWDGLESLSLQTCDPCFIEICRRLRIVPFAHGGLAVRVAPTQTARIDPHRDKDLATGDVWTPRKVDSGAALTVTDRLTYDLLRKVMFDGGYHPAATQVWRAVDGRTPSFVAKVLARGKSKTAGYHHRTLPIPPGGTRFFSRPEERERIAKLAEAMVKTAEVARNRVLRPALLYLLQGAPDKLNREDKRAAPWCERLEDLIDFSFFEYLFAGAEKMEGQALDDWKQALRDWAESVLRHAVGAAPVSATRRIKAIAVADNVFRALAHRHLAATAGDSATNRPPEVDHERSA